MKTFIVEESFWKLFPQAEIGVLCVDNMTPTSQISSEKVQAAADYLQRANRIAQKWIESPTISQNSVVSIWRDAYRLFKTKKGARCAIENLIKRIIHDNPVSSICPSVDITNGISLTYAMPIGIENLDAVEGNFRLLQTKKGGHAFVALGSEENDPTLPLEVAYVDDAGAICRCWNWRDGRRTAASDDTPHCVCIMECLDPARSDGLHAAIDELEKLLITLLDAQVTHKDFITHTHPQTKLV